MKVLNDLVIGAATKRARYLAQKRADKWTLAAMLVFTALACWSAFL